MAKAATDLAVRRMTSARQWRESAGAGCRRGPATSAGEGVGKSRRGVGSALPGVSPRNASRESIQSALDQSAHELSATEKLIVDATEKAAEGMPDDSSKLHGEAIRQLAASAGKVAALLPKPSTFMEAEPTTIKAATILEQAESAMRRVLEQLNVKAGGKAPEKAMRIAADSLSAAAKARMELMGK